MQIARVHGHIGKNILTIELELLHPPQIGLEHTSFDHCGLNSKLLSSVTVLDCSVAVQETALLGISSDITLVVSYGGPCSLMNPL